MEPDAPFVDRVPELAFEPVPTLKGTANNCRFAATEACVAPRRFAGRRRGMDRLEYCLPKLARKTCNGRPRNLRFLLSGTAPETGSRRGRPVREASGYAVAGAAFSRCVNLRMLWARFLRPIWVRARMAPMLRTRVPPISFAYDPKTCSTRARTLAGS